MNGDSHAATHSFERTVPRAHSGVADVFVRRLTALHPPLGYEAPAIAGLVRDVSAYGPHHDIIEEGQRTSVAYVLLEGLACHYRSLETTRRQLTGFVVPGDFCDLAFLSSSPARHSVMSLGKIVIGRIDLGQLAALAERLPDVIVAAMRASTIEQASARELAVSLGARDAVQRLAHCLCELHARMSGVGLVSASSQFELNLTQAELGEALGLSTVHVNRTIQHLRRSKLITIGQGMVTILDGPRLAAIASFDGKYLRSS